MKTLNKSLFVWNALRISFWLLIAVWFMASITDVPILISIILALLIISTFTLSIIHLIKYKEKALAITSLCISSFGMFFLLIGVLAGIMEEIA